jgi:hypothetical protein
MSGELDILAALRDETNATATHRCVVQRWLDSIPEDAPGKADLVATFSEADRKSEHYRQLDALDRLSQRLGFASSIKSIGDHRAGRCRCRV